MRNRKANAVYSKTEQRILDALVKKLKEERSINVRTARVSLEAGIALSSFYIHYDSLSDLIIKNEQKLLSELKEYLIKKNYYKNLTIEGQYRNILLFLRRYRAFLDVSIKTDNIETLLKIIDLLKPIIKQTWPTYNISLSSKLYRLVAMEYIFELQLWSAEDYSVVKISEHAHHLCYLSRHAPQFYATLYE